MNKLILIGLLLIIASCSDKVEDKKSETSDVLGESNNQSEYYYSMSNLNAMAAQLSAKLPMQYDSVTVLNSASAQAGRIVQYSYNIDMDAMLTVMGKEMHMSVATVKSMLSKRGGTRELF